MWQLIRFEIEKVMNKKVVWLCLVGMVLMECAMIINWIYPSTEGTQYFQGEELVEHGGIEGIRESVAIAGKYAGPLTDEKVQAILAEYDWPDDKMKAHDMDPAREGYYTHNALYSSMKDFYGWDGKWNGMTVEEVYGDLASGIEIGYSSGWVSLMYAITHVLLSLGCVLTIILAPLFAEEYTKGMDALILTGAYGKTKCAWAKIITGFLVSLALMGTAILTMAAVYLASHGTAGLQASIQVSDTGIYRNVAYPMTCGQGILFALLMWFTGSLVLAAASIYVSARAKSAFNSLILSFALFTIPLFLPWETMGFLNFPAQFLPIRQMQLFDIFHLPLFQVGGLQLNFMWLTIPVALAAVFLGSVLSRRAFARHQVMG